MCIRYLAMCKVADGSRVLPLNDTSAAPPKRCLTRARPHDPGGLHTRVRLAELVFLLQHGKKPDGHQPRDGRKPTVAIIGTRGYPSFYGGFETLVRHLAPYLADAGWNVEVYSRDDAISTMKTVTPGVRSVFTPGLEYKSLSTISYGLTAAAHSAATKPDVALVMNVANGFWLPMLKARGIPTVVNVDGLEWERDKWGSLAKSVFRAGASMTARWADTLICDAEEIARYWRDEFGRDSVFIPYGGEPPCAHRVLDKVQEGEFVLFVARLVPENTVDEFLCAAEELARERDVVIVGSSGYEGPVETQVRRISESYGRIHWLGQVSDDDLLFSLWSKSGVYFHGHSVGGTNPALVQAMACGAPTVARDTPYNREVLGDSGYFVAPTAESIVDGVRAVLGSDERRSRMSQQAVQRQHHRYTWDIVCGLYEQTLRQAVPGAVRADADA